MCGITGWVDYERDGPARRDIIEAMTATMACRGPDAGHTWCSPRTAIGHRRLAVVDIEGGGQPMLAGLDPGVVLSFSGEIYNHRELRTELAGYGHEFRTRSDTEVLLRAWLQWGAGCLPRLNGMFAFAVWDAAQEELVLARDRMGVKPLYYAPRPAGVLFGSEPKAVLAHPEFPAELDATGIAELFSQLGTRTPGHGVYRGLAEVKPGCSIRVSRDGISTSRYWQLEACPHTDDLAITAGTVRELLTDIVGRQLIADVPVASLLSGGLDSCTLSALAARALGRQDRGKLATYSVDFPGSQAAFRPDRLRPSHDEPYARQAAEHIASRHTTILLDDLDLSAAQHVPLRAHDLPVYGDMYTSMYLLSRELRRHCTVALSGESADEVFGGYPWYHDDAALATPGYPWAARGSWAGLLRPDVGRQVRLDEHTADGYATAVAEVPWLAGEDARERRIREVLYLGLTRWLPFLLDRKDRLSMATGLEVRVPFCDHRLVEYVWNVPWPVKETGGMEKGLLRAAAAGLLPDSLLRRRKSIYPSAAGTAHEQGVYGQLAGLLGQPHAPLFDLVDRGRLATEFRDDPTLPGRMAVQPAAAAPAAFLLDVNEWLSSYHVRLV
jgi:asparagine synthase (glutamine-hydrolysing)